MVAENDHIIRNLVHGYSVNFKRLLLRNRYDLNGEAYELWSLQIGVSTFQQIEQPSDEGKIGGHNCEISVSDTESPLSVQHFNRDQPK